MRRDLPYSDSFNFPVKWFQRDCLCKAVIDCQVRMCNFLKLPNDKVIYCSKSILCKVFRCFVLCVAMANIRKIACMLTRFFHVTDCAIRHVNWWSITNSWYWLWNTSVASRPLWWPQKMIKRGFFYKFLN